MTTKPDRSFERPLGVVQPVGRAVGERPLFAHSRRPLRRAWKAEIPITDGIAEVVPTKDGIRIKFHDKQAALLNSASIWPYSKRRCMA
jgi:hypothetical protein